MEKEKNGNLKFLNTIAESNFWKSFDKQEKSNGKKQQFNKPMNPCS